MAYVVLAAQQLISEISDLYPKSKVEPTDELDGLGFHRAIKAHTTQAKWIAGLIEDDPRVESVVATPKTLTVHFVPGVAASDKTPFDLAEGLAAVEEG